MNEQPYPIANLTTRRKGLAIAAEIMGAINLPFAFITSNFFLAGTIIRLVLGIIALSLVLGIIALGKAKRQPESYTGEIEARRGIVCSILSLMTLFIAILVLPGFLISQHYPREVAALRDMQAIGIAQLQYARTKGHGQYADLQTLEKENLVEIGLMSKGGYIFTSISVEGGDKPMYDTTARPSSTGIRGVGDRSFYSNEAQVVYDAEGSTPPTATPQNRIPEDGKPIQ
jgi:hypothetical protein